MCGLDLEGSVTANLYTSSHLDCGSSWCRSRRRRCVDIIASGLGLALLLPVIVVISLGVLISSGKPIFFAQKRLGRYAREFTLLKFRTMKTIMQGGPGVTQDGDARVTRIGRWLRRRKLDELPQLFNVLRGDMTLIGPRPDLEEFWLQAEAEDRRVLELTPGMTGAASLAFFDEEKLLAKVPRERLTSFYVREILPQKARLDIGYAEQATFRSDCGILLRTMFLPLRDRDDKVSSAKEFDEHISS